MRRTLLTVVLVLLLPDLANAQNQPPVANAGADQTVYASDLAVLQGSATDPDGDAIIVWSWAVVEAPVGAAWTLTLEDRPGARFVPLAAGDFVLSLTVLDAYYNVSQSDFVTVHAADNLPPVAVATADRTTIRVGETVCFDGSQSSDPEGGPLRYIWDFANGSPYLLDVVSPCYAYSSVGSYSALLGVTDERGAFDTDTVDITALPAAAVPSLPRSGLWLLGLLLSLSGGAQISRRVEGKS